MRGHAHTRVRRARLPRDQVGRATKSSDEYASLSERGPQDMLIRASTRTAACEFAVNHDGWHAANTVLLRLGSNFGLLHVVDDYLVRRTGYPLDELNCLLASGTAGAEDFNFLFRCHVLFSLNTPEFLGR